MTLILSSTDVLTDEKGFCVYELHHLLPNTDYELRMCSVNNHVKGQHTESKTHQTLKTGENTLVYTFHYSFIILNEIVIS